MVAIMSTMAKVQERQASNYDAQRLDREDDKLSKKEELVIITAGDSSTFFRELIAFEEQMKRLRISRARAIYQRFMEAIKKGNLALYYEITELQNEGAGEYFFSAAVASEGFGDREEAAYRALFAWVRRTVLVNKN